MRAQLVVGPLAHCLDLVQDLPQLTDLLVQLPFELPHALHKTIDSLRHLDLSSLLVLQ